MTEVEAVVVGRVGVDLTPPSPGTSLAEADSFVRAVGGFAGNVGTGLARLGVRTAVVSSVGDDGHGAHVRAFLSGEGIVTTNVVERRGTRTQVAFFEAWPPDRFPVSFYRPAPAPDTLLEPADLPDDDLVGAPLVIVSGTLLASEPARATTLGLLERRRASRAARPASWTILDLDWRPALWSDPGEAPAIVARAAHLVDVLVGSDQEFAAARLDPDTIPGERPSLVALKHGPGGVSAITGDARETVAGIPVEVVCGLGSGDAFVAAFAAGLLRGLAPADALERGNAAGAIVATRLFCSTAMPRPDEIDRLLDKPAAQRVEARA